MLPIAVSRPSIAKVIKLVNSSQRTQRITPEPRDEAYRDWIFTVPNMICMFRIAGSILMVIVALLGFEYWFVGLFIALSLSDWIDGRLARWMHQRSDFGARLDSFADSVLYGALLLGTISLCFDTLKTEWIWIVLAVLSYLLTSGAGLIKFGKIPSYHTQAAKKSQFVVLVAGVALVLGLSVWPLRIAALAAIYTNLEATIMTCLLPRWHADVPSLRYVLRHKSEFFDPVTESADENE